MICSVCGKPVAFTDSCAEVSARHKGCDAPKRRLIGYRVVRQRATVRQWLTVDNGWSDHIGEAWLFAGGVAELTAVGHAAHYGGRVVAVYLTVRRATHRATGAG